MYTVHSYTIHRLMLVVITNKFVILSDQPCRTVFVLGLKKHSTCLHHVDSKPFVVITSGSCFSIMIDAPCMVFTAEVVSYSNRPALQGHAAIVMSTLSFIICYDHIRLQFQQCYQELFHTNSSREWNSDCDWSPATSGRVQLPGGNPAGGNEDQDLSQQ